MDARRSEHSVNIVSNSDAGLKVARTLRASRWLSNPAMMQRASVNSEKIRAHSLLRNSRRLAINCAISATNWVSVGATAGAFGERFGCLVCAITSQVYPRVSSLVILFFTFFRSNDQAVKQRNIAAAAGVRRRRRSRSWTFQIVGGRLFDGVRVYSLAITLGRRAGGRRVHPLLSPRHPLGLTLTLPLTLPLGLPLGVPAPSPMRSPAPSPRRSPRPSPMRFPMRFPRQNRARSHK